MGRLHNPPFLKPFPENFGQRALYFKSWSSPIKHEFKDIFQENDCGFEGKKPHVNAFHRI